MPTDDLLAILALFGVAAWLLSLFRLLITKLSPLVTGRFRFRRNSEESPNLRSASIQDEKARQGLPGWLIPGSSTAQSCTYG